MFAGRVALSMMVAREKVEAQLGPEYWESIDDTYNAINDIIRYEGRPLLNGAIAVVICPVVMIILVFTNPEFINWATDVARVSPDWLGGIMALICMVVAIMIGLLSRKFCQRRLWEKKFRLQCMSTKVLEAIVWTDTSTICGTLAAEALGKKP